MHRMQGILRSPTCRTYPQGLTWGSTSPVCSMQSQEWLVGSAPSSIGTPNGWFASAFTQGSLPWNRQTLLGCQCALEGLRLPVLRPSKRTLRVCRIDIRLSSIYTLGVEKKAHKPTTIRLTEQDRVLLARIKELYGCPSDIAAIRLALRMVARGEIPSACGHGKLTMPHS